MSQSRREGRGSISESLADTLIANNSSVDRSVADVVLPKSEKRGQGMDQFRYTNSANDRYLLSTEHAIHENWTKSKWILLTANSLMLVMSLCIFFFILITYSRGYLRAEVLVTGNSGLMGIMTVFSLVGIANSVIGYYGILNNDRKILAIWALILWVMLILIAIVGYLAYKRQLWNLRAKLGHQWRYFGYQERLNIQNNLHCCGFKGPFDHAALSNKCYLRSLLPGCLGKYYRFSDQALKLIYIVAFSLLIPQLYIILVSILCANHVNNIFNKNPPPAVNR
ncbi:hypothetical protein K7432_011134 [Basidiobolus ranarum]|uniref:Tetraspanin n=1 Tax=Basidiobolus ranarum TaxID=34480 RepID=A0ABR2WMT3_9FUNG